MKPYSLGGGKTVFPVKHSILIQAVYHHWFSAPADDYGWSQSQYWDVPNTWAAVQLSASSTPACTYFPLIQLVTQ